VKLILRAFVLGAVLVVSGFVAAQFGNAADPRNDNPKPGASLEAIAHPPEEVARILRDSCYDCHSAHTKWPWYSHLPFIGTELEKHVKGGRTELDLSDWQGHIDASEREDKLEDMCIQATARKMPVPQYLMLHPQARPSDAEIETLCKWTATERSKSE
jgi:Haem-binding domain